jgi:hypothetical protein
MVDRYIAQAHSITPLLPLSAYSRNGLSEINYIAIMKDTRLNITGHDGVRQNTKPCITSHAFQMLFAGTTKRKRLKQ